MLKLRLGRTLIALLFLASPALARFARVEIEKVPVERITKNLDEIIRKDPKNAAATLNLARAHAMAFSMRVDELPVNAKTPDAVWFGYGARIVPFSTITATEDKEKLKVAREHLEKSIKLYEDVLKLTPDDARARLGYGWLLSQTDKKEDAIAALRKAIEKGWEKEQTLRTQGLGNDIISIEGAGYLVPLLDKEKDKTEIATLEERAAKLRKLPRFVTPIAVPLNAGLAAGNIENRRASVAFDADGSGLQTKWTWINPNAAWLVHDPKGAGKVTSGLQLFGNVTFWMFWETGYGPLTALDDNHDGRLSGGELTGLSLWHDRNGNGVSDAGEVRPVGEHGIVSISCAYTRDASHPDRIAFSPAGVTFRDGSTRPTFDVVLHPAK